MYYLFLDLLYEIFTRSAYHALGYSGLSGWNAIIPIGS
jgi:hypothetical protein